jgi:succinate dehydrogenase/fumarate reductase flavoprotein subunit
MMPPAASATPSAWDREVDLLVVGAGAGGMTAALVASLEGFNVLLCEKTSQVGGTTAISGGAIWIPGSTQSRRVGLTDTAAEARRYLDAVIGAADEDGRRDAFIEVGAAALDYLESRSEVKFAPSPKHPDYRSALPGAALAGRALYPLPFDGRLLGADFALLRAPIPELMALGGMMVGRDDLTHLLHPFASVASFQHTLALVLRYLWDRTRYERGTRLLLGNALAARLLFSLRQRQVPIWLDAPVRNLVLDQGCVAGAVVFEDGMQRSIRAKQGVILASGGFSGSTVWREALLPDPIASHSVAFEGASGDGLALAQSVGGMIDKQHASPVFWMPASIMRRPDGSQAIFPHIVLDRAKPGLIAVNAAGRRFVNEADSYHDFVLGMYRSHKTVCTIPAYLVCDRRFIRDYGIGLIRPGERRLQRYVNARYLFEAPTLLELAAKIGVDGAALSYTVDRHNRFAESGIDEDFGKGSSELNRHNGDPGNAPNPCLRKIEEAPFFAVAVHPADLGTSAGLAADRDGRVLGRNGIAIPGLYACGNDMASVMRGHYPGPGITLGPAIAFAFRIVRHISRQGSRALTNGTAQTAS